MTRFTRTCSECGRVFDLLDPVDDEEWLYGHDCEAPVEIEPEAAK